jgi:hypothetical protein
MSWEWRTSDAAEASVKASRRQAVVDPAAVDRLQEGLFEPRSVRPRRCGAWER